MTHGACARVGFVGRAEPPRNASARATGCGSRGARAGRARGSAHLELGGMCATQLKEHQRALKERADGELQSSAELDDQNTQDSATSAAPRSRAPSLRKKM